MRELAFGLAGGVAAVGVELLFKRFPTAPYLTLYLATIPFQAVINWSIWNILQRDSLLGLAIWFSASTALLRLAATMWLGTTIGELTWAAYALIIAAMVMKIGEAYGR